MMKDLTPSAKRTRRAAAFTLVELLVVITIIVILIALLAPTLDVAVYQAELVRCSGNHRAIAMGAFQYASGNRRAYPRRLNGRGAGSFNVSHVSFKSDLDVRPFYRPYVSLDVFVDPLCGGIDVREEANIPETIILGNLTLWAGWGYYGEKAMRRMGDAFAWEGRAYRVISGDRDVSIQLSTITQSHPDREGRGVYKGQQNLDNPWEQQARLGIQGLGTSKHTFSWYESTLGRGPVEMNYAFDDGAVLRYADVAVDDPRCGAVPEFADANGWANNRVVYIPAGVAASP